MKNTIIDGDYILADGCGWFEIDGYAIRIHRGTDDLSVEICRNGNEGASALASVKVYDFELQGEE